MDAGDHRQRLHGKLSGSKMEQVEACPGSVTLYGHIEGRESSYAAEGTQAHEALESVLKTGEWPKGTSRTLQLSLGHLVRWIEDGRNRGAIVMTEMSLAHKVYPWVTGTLDMAILVPLVCMIIADLKWGAGIDVEVEENVQLGFYAILLDPQGLYDHILKFLIYQPRSGGFKYWDVPLPWIKALRARVDRVIQRVLANDQTLKEGSHCRFCPAAHVCKLKQAGFADVSLHASFGVESVNGMDDQTLLKLWKQKEALGPFFKRIDEEARLRAGANKLPGYKLTQSEGHRKWAWDEKTTVDRLTALGLSAADCYEREVISPNVAGQRLGRGAKDEIELMVTRPGSGKYSIVPIDAPGQAVSQAGSASNVFGAGK